MDRFTILREDLDAMSAAGIPEHVIERVVLAMVRYGLDGQEPDFSPRGSDPEELTQAVMARVAFGMVKGRIDKYVAKAGNAKGRGTESKETETEAKGTETDGAEIEENRNESKRIETDKDKEKEEEKEQGEAYSETPVPEGEDTHVQTAGKGRRGRARAGWFDPANPEGPDDGAWRYSEEARRATAQRILTHVLRSGRLREQFRVTDEGEVIGQDLFPVICAALKYGMPPREVLQESDDARAAWQWEQYLREWVTDRGGRVDLPERMAEPEAAYG